MLKTGDYKTLNGYDACVLFVDEDGIGGGYAYNHNGKKTAQCWDSDGSNCFDDDAYDLDLSLYTITIPETKLPAPVREKPERGTVCYCVLPHSSMGWLAGCNERRGHAQGF